MYKTTQWTRLDYRIAIWQAFKRLPQPKMSGAYESYMKISDRLHDLAKKRETFETIHQSIVFLSVGLNDWNEKQTADYADRQKDPLGFAFFRTRSEGIEKAYKNYCSHYKEFMHVARDATNAYFRARAELFSPRALNLTDAIADLRFKVASLDDKFENLCSAAEDFVDLMSSILPKNHPGYKLAQNAASQLMEAPVREIPNRRFGGIRPGLA